ncbi:HEAT repeat domain-containing protein [Planctomycetota bacterium]
MFRAKTFTVILCLVGVAAISCGAGELKDDWNDFLHYTKIGRFDMAKAYAQAILEANPEPQALIDLAAANEQGYEILLRIQKNQNDSELASLTDRVLAIVEQGRNLKLSDPQLIVQEVQRLSSPTPRGRMIALKRLKDNGEYAVPFMLDALGDPARRDEFVNIVEALPQLGQPAIRPLVAALQNRDSAVKIEIVKALGGVGYPQSLPYLKFVIENNPSSEIQMQAAASMQQIDPLAQSTAAAELFHTLGENYYYHNASLSPVSKSGHTNMWFWDETKRRLVWNPVDSQIFNEMMAMRCCEWSLRANPGMGQSIGLWLASYFKAEATGTAMPEFFGPDHANAFVYGTTAGPMYLHQALARGLSDKDAGVALAATEALIATAGPKTLFASVGAVQPLLQALVYSDEAVRTSAAIAVAQAGPQGPFDQSGLVIRNLATAVSNGLAAGDAYVQRSLVALRAISQQRNMAFDLLGAQEALVAASRSESAEYKTLACQALAGVNSGTAQQAIAEVGISDRSDLTVRIAAFNSLAESAKVNGSMLSGQTLANMYELIGSGTTDANLRTAAAMAFGALNLPSENVKGLILHQAKS